MMDWLLEENWQGMKVDEKKETKPRIVKTDHDWTLM